MNLKINTLLSDLNEQLNFIDIEFDDTINRCEKAIEIIIVSIQKLKILFLKEKFKNQEQEIDFFKNIKPKFTSKLIYYNVIFKIETKKNFKDTVVAVPVMPDDKANPQIS